MNPANVGCLTVARPDVCALANNHVLDFGQQRPGGDPRHAGRCRAAGGGGGPGRGRGGGGRRWSAWRAAARVSVVSCGTGSSGIPSRWAAGRVSRPGVDLLPGLSRHAADRVSGRAAGGRRSPAIIDGGLAALGIELGI